MLNNIVAQLGTGAGGGGGAFESIATVSGTGSSGTITFSSIPSTYQHLQIRSSVKVGSAVAQYVRFNSDTGNNYARHNLTGYGSGTYTESLASTSAMQYFPVYNSLNSTYQNVGILEVLDYASSSKNKTMRAFQGFDANGSGEVDLTSGLWMNTSAITQIDIYLASGTYSSGTTFALYGIKGS